MSNQYYWRRYFLDDDQIAEAERAGIKSARIRALLNDGGIAIMCGDRRRAVVDATRTFKRGERKDDDPERDAFADELVTALNSYAKHKAVIKKLTTALEGMLMEYDQASRYGSPMARAANERVAFARAALAAAKESEGT